MEEVVKFCARVMIEARFAETAFVVPLARVAELLAAELDKSSSWVARLQSITSHARLVYNLRLPRHITLSLTCSDEMDHT